MGKTTRIDTYLSTAANLAGKRGRAKAAHVTGIAILADEDEWRALAEQNPLFEFKSYQSYLVDIERRLRAAARAGRQVLVGPLMPDQFETRADAAGLPRDSPRALKEYERFVAELGPLTRPWTGEPITQVLEHLRAHVRAETLQAAAMPTLYSAADLHENPHEAAQRAMSQAAHILMAIADGAGDGQHDLHIHVTHPEGDLDYTLPYSRCGKVIAFPDDGGEQMTVVLLAIASLAERPGTLTLRSRSHPAFFPPRRKPKAKDSPSATPAAATPAAHGATPAAARPAAALGTTPASASAPALGATPAAATPAAHGATPTSASAPPAAHGATPASACAPAAAHSATPASACAPAAAHSATPTAATPTAATHAATLGATPAAAAAATHAAALDATPSAETPTAAAFRAIPTPNSAPAGSPPIPAHSDPRDSILRGWRLGSLIPQPMSEGQLFAFTCTAPSGEATPPEPGTRFRAAFPLEPDACSSCP
ncbi:hypothetical protein [Actinospica sp.]|uniref:hypothetical protein n=1 Tax=Actinospica sp. TaxID=1872142 RepID=UPI002C56DDFB|nr:hypothetical protein [Actinospica sp.]HWG28693.1 hypothetical protein [Actinospica sp.]